MAFKAHMRQPAAETLLKTRGFFRRAFARLANFAFALVFLIFSLGVPVLGAAEAGGNDRRIALVIGNSRYAHVETLENPANDAKAIEAKLSALGFEVFAGTDLNLAGFRQLSGKFQAEAKTADTALIYYSGHGFQFQGQNFIVPIDASLRSKQAIETETVRLNDLIANVQSRERQVLVFLDACRNNPLPPGQRRDNGLAQVATDNNVFVAFATQPGNISYDGRSKLSPFTKSLVSHMSGERQSISDLMIAVRNDVEKMTLGQQTPWDQSSLKKQFYFDPDASGAAPEEKLASLPPGAAAGSEISVLQRSTVIEAPDAGLGVLEAYPSGNVILLPEAPVEIFGKEDLVTAVQGELKRVGCYQGDADGVWSAGSREALSKYYRTKKLKPTDSDPTEFHLNNLQGETGIVCVYVAPKQPVFRAVAKPQAPKRFAEPTAKQRAPAFLNKRNAKPVKRNIAAAKAPQRKGPRNATADAPAAPKRNSLADANVVGGFR
jgi:Caspase domain